MKKPFSLKTRLALSTAVAVLITVALIGFLANLFINKQFLSYISSQQENRTKEFVALVTKEYQENESPSSGMNRHGGGGHNGSNSIYWNMEEINQIGLSAISDGYLIRLMDNEGNAVWDAQRSDSKKCHQVMEDIGVRMENSRFAGQGALVTKTFVMEKDGEEIGVMEVSHYGPYFLNESDFQFLDSLNIMMILVAVGALLLAVIMGIALASKVSKPITQTSMVAKQMADGNYKIRLDGHTKIKELDELTVSINHLAQRLEQQEALRKKLTADVAHELRTPLTTMSTHIEAMMEGVWEPTPERLSSCYEELGRITGLVKDLENLAKVEQENLNLQKTSFDLWILLEKSIQSYGLEIEQKQLTVSTEISPAVVLADSDRIHQVIQNLLSNAVKYTPEGGKIRISTRVDEGNVLLSVADNGLGIPEEEISFVFERFYRADKSRNRGTGGAGIGMAVAKAIVDAHGGTIEVHSRLNEGTDFLVTLPQ